MRHVLYIPSLLSIIKIRIFPPNDSNVHLTLSNDTIFSSLLVKRIIIFDISWEADSLLSPHCFLYTFRSIKVAAQLLFD